MSTMAVLTPPAAPQDTPSGTGNSRSAGIAIRSACAPRHVGRP
ncbi:hypothetical protein [Amycolatopsis acidicola]|nr:hypothetical protein [Amycolatopsis acidicola]